MDRLLVYHNPVCSKSRGTLEILRERGVAVEVVEYLRQPPDRAGYERILDLLDDDPAALVRHDARFRELELDPDAYRSREAVVDLLLAHPELMERPVVVRGSRAVIARPPEKVLGLLG